MKTDSRNSLQEVVARVAERPGVGAALVITTDGLPVAVHDREGLVRDPETWAGVVAALTALAAQLSLSLQRGGLEGAVFRAERRWLVVRLISVGYLLLVTAQEPAPSTVEEAAEEVARALEGLTAHKGSDR